MGKARVQLEAELVLGGAQHIELSTVKSYVQDLRNLLEESDFVQSKSFLRSFIRRIVINKKQVVIYYNLPVPSTRGKQQVAEVLPIVTPGGPEGTIPRTETVSC